MNRRTLWMLAIAFLSSCGDDGGGTAQEDAPAAAVPESADGEVLDSFDRAPALASSVSTPNQQGEITELRLVAIPAVTLLEYTGPQRCGMCADRILVQARDYTSEEAMRRLASRNGHGIESLEDGLYSILLPTDRLEADVRAGVHPIRSAVERYASEPIVAYAEPDFAHTLQATPNDTYFADQWGMQKIKAPAAWDITKGKKVVKVAVIDTGVAYTHPDLSPNVWTNPNETPGNGVDDDNNGHVDDVHGYDFVNNDGDPKDDHGHGSHVAGTIGARGNNNMGVAGVCWQVSLVAVKIADAQGVVTVGRAIKGLKYAWKVGCKITNHSYTINGFSQAFSDAVKTANTKGVLVVAAAGNAYKNIETFPIYPASFTHSNMITVLSIKQDGKLSIHLPAWGSNYGKTSVDLGAPGSSIISTWLNNNYAVSGGTSMATPHVAGACALVKAVHPTWTHSQIKSKILSSVTANSNLTPYCATGGHLNVWKALE